MNISVSSVTPGVYIHVDMYKYVVNLGLDALDSRDSGNEHVPDIHAYQIIARIR